MATTYQEEVCLGRWTYKVAEKGNLTTNWTPSAAEGNAELAAHEVAEITRAIYRAPVDPVTGTSDPIDTIYFVLDDEPIPQHVRLPGRNHLNLAPPVEYTARVFGPYAEWEIPFGKSLPEVLAEPGANQLLKATTLKYAKRVRPVFEVPVGGTVSHDFELELRGFRYNEKERAARLGGASLNGQITIVDKLRNRTFSLNKSVVVDEAHWTELPGGPRQANPVIMPYWRWATNNQEINAYQPYQFRHETNGVTDRYQNLYWPFDQEDTAILLQFWGLRAIGYSGEAWIHVTSDPIRQEHPNGRVLFRPNNNPLHFGTAQPFLPDGWPVYWLPRRFANHQILLWDDLSYLAIQALPGTSIPAGGVEVAVIGVSITNLKRR